MCFKGLSQSPFCFCVPSLHLENSFHLSQYKFVKVCVCVSLALVLRLKLKSPLRFASISKACIVKSSQSFPMNKGPAHLCTTMQCFNTANLRPAPPLSWTQSPGYMVTVGRGGTLCARVRRWLLFCLALCDGQQHSIAIPLPSATDMGAVTPPNALCSGPPPPLTLSPPFHPLPHHNRSISLD